MSSQSSSILPLSHPSFYAAIDLGSNSFRLLIAKRKGLSFDVLHKELITVRLFQGMADLCTISPSSLSRAYAALSHFHGLIAAFPLCVVRVCGTEALRKASDCSSFVIWASELFGVDVEVLSGCDESTLSAEGVCQFLPLSASRKIICDVGGGSSEVTCVGAGDLVSMSYAVGAVGVTEKFHLNGPVSDEVITKVLVYIRNIFADTLPEATTHSFALIGTGGTATTLAALDLNLVEYDDAAVHGHRLSRSTVDSLIVRFISSGASIHSLPSLDQGRGDILLAGTLIYKVLLELYCQDGLVVSDTGLLEGILLSLL